MPAKWVLAVKKLDGGSHLHLCVWWDEAAERVMQLYSRRVDRSCEKCVCWNVRMEVRDVPAESKVEKRPITAADINF